MEHISPGVMTGNAEPPGREEVDFCARSVPIGSKPSPARGVRGAASLEEVYFDSDVAKLSGVTIKRSADCARMELPVVTRVGVISVVWRYGIGTGNPSIVGGFEKSPGGNLGRPGGESFVVGSLVLLWS